MGTLARNWLFTKHVYTNFRALLFINDFFPERIVTTMWILLTNVDITPFVTGKIEYVKNS